MPCKHHLDTITDQVESCLAAARLREEVVHLIDTGVPVHRAEEDAPKRVSEHHGAGHIVVPDVHMRQARGDPGADVRMVRELRKES